MLEVITNTDYGVVFSEYVVLSCLHIMVIILSILITKGEYGLTRGRFKIYCIVVFLCVLCNFVEIVLMYFELFDFIQPIKGICFIGGIFIIFKIQSFINNGDPCWYTGDEFEENVNTFSGTVGSVFCIMISYMLTTCVLIKIAVIISIFQTVLENDKYKFSRVVPLSIINIVEIIVASKLIGWAYEFSFVISIFYVLLIGLIANILLPTINDDILDWITKGKFLKE